MRIALVHDYLIQYGGAERVLEEFCAIFPSAPIFTLLYDAKATGYAFEGRDIRTSFLQRFPKAASFHRFFALSMPLAIESLDLKQYNLVLSSSASFAKGVITQGDSLHISYCHSPMRYAWHDYKKFTGDSIFPSFISKTIPFFMPYMRLWDKNSAQRPDHYICNSSFIKKQIKKYYELDASVLYPPLNFNKFYIDSPRNYFLLVGRMVPYKRFDLAIKAFNEMGFSLKIVGSGPEYKRLKELAGPSIEFLGLVSEKELARLYAQSRALIFPQQEDFGITAIESMASGRPVIAYGAGGALESVKDYKTGVLFLNQTVESLKEAVYKFNKAGFDPKYIRSSVEKFDRKYFRENILKFINDRMEERNKLIRS